MTTVQFYNSELEIIKTQKNITGYVTPETAKKKMHAVKGCTSVSVYRNGSFDFEVEK